MDSVEKLVQLAQTLTTVKCVIVSGTALTLYDYSLMLSDEIRYVWRGRKTWISYFYIIIRTLLTVNQLYNIFFLSASMHTKTLCLARYFISALSIKFYIFSSEVFITLRIYAITSKNKILLVYFGGLALARLAVWFASAHAEPPVVIDPRVPTDVANFCVTILRPRFKLVPNSIGIVFDVSAFLVIVWKAYRIKFSSLIRTIAADATMYFLVMAVAQTYAQIAYVLADGLVSQISFLVYAIINPVLTLRFAVSLKRSADLDGGEEWRLKHFSSVNFVGDGTQVSAVRGDIEMDPVDPLNRRLSTREP